MRISYLMHNNTKLGIRVYMGDGRVYDIERSEWRLLRLSEDFAVEPKKEKLWDRNGYLYTEDELNGWIKPKDITSNPNSIMQLYDMLIARGILIDANYKDIVMQEGLMTRKKNKQDITITVFIACHDYSVSKYGIHRDTYDCFIVAHEADDNLKKLCRALDSKEEASVVYEQARGSVRRGEVKAIQTRISSFVLEKIIDMPFVEVAIPKDGLVFNLTNSDLPNIVSHTFKSKDVVSGIPFHLQDVVVNYDKENDKNETLVHYAGDLQKKIRTGVFTVSEKYGVRALLGMRF